MSMAVLVIRVRLACFHGVTQPSHSEEDQRVLNSKKSPALPCSRMMRAFIKPGLGVVLMFAVIIVLAFLSALAIEPDRIVGEKCNKADIVINQGPSPPLPSGIPTYTVEITNVCATGCDISGIHLRCGWFSSARLINPMIFKRIRFNDCLVNDGKPLLNGDILSFKYANTFPYPLSVSTVACP